MALSRRAFLARTGWLAGGVTVLATTGCSLIPPLPTFGTSDDADSVTWVQLQSDGRIRFWVPRAELGQGISTGLAHIVAEELGVGVAEIDCHHQSTAIQAPCQMTVGSQSMENYRAVTARAAARLREVLRSRAVARAGGAPADWSLGAGEWVSPSGERLAFAQLVDTKEATVLAEPIDGPLELLSARPAAELSVVGKPAPGANLERIVTGAETYSRDVRVPDMRYGQVAKPPQLGAVMGRFNRAAAEAVAGVEAVVEFESEVGVVALTPHAAAQGIAALDVQWQPLTDAERDAADRPVDIDEAIASGELDHEPIDEGSIARGREASVETVSLRYDSPMVAHAAMEPRSAVASVITYADGKTLCEVWSGSQDPWLVQDLVSRATGLSRENTIVRNHRVGGAFGGRVMCQAAVEAAWLSAAVRQPVKVQWSREDEFRHNYVGPPYSTRIDAGIDSTGHIAFWHHRAIGAPILTSSLFVPSALTWVADQIPDPGTRRGLAVPYRFENHLTEFADRRLAMPTGPWRGLGAAPNTFAIECAMDELALAAGRDPIAFRLAHLDNPRLATCLTTLARQIDLDAATAGESVGIAAAVYKGVTFLAVAARVAVDSGKPRVTQLVCVHDCGQVVSPDQVRAQIEGNLVWGIGMALSEAFEVRGGIGASDNFDRYALPRQADVPDMQITLINSDEPSSGAAEAALAPAAAAIANALARSTGDRARRLPLSAA